MSPRMPCVAPSCCAPYVHPCLAKPNCLQFCPLLLSSPMSHAVFCLHDFALAIPSAKYRTPSPLSLVWLVLTYSSTLTMIISSRKHPCFPRLVKGPLPYIPIATKIHLCFSPTICIFKWSVSARVSSSRL